MAALSAVEEAIPQEFEEPVDWKKPLGGAVIKLSNIEKSYELVGGERVPALKIRGPSGGGKTTLLNICGTIDKPSQGILELFGERIDFAKVDDGFLAQLRLKRIGFVFQTFNLLATLSAFENVELPMSILGVLSKRERTARAKLLLKMVGLEDRMSHLPSELSGGEQQRVTIARALSNDPDILLLDEPTGDLDTRNTIEVMDLLTHINKDYRVTCLMVTHNPDLECYADRILYVADGTFESQAVNADPTPLSFESYLNFLNQEAVGDDT